MEKDKPNCIGKLNQDEVNPTEKICEILKCANLRELIKTFKNSPNASEAINESFIPLRK